MAEDALPKDERRQTMKRIIAILLALIMIFAFAACKGKDDKNDTTAESSQDANADVQDTQTGDAESNAAESTADNSITGGRGASHFFWHRAVSRAASRATSPQPKSRLPSTAARLRSLRSSTSTLRL